MVTTLNRFAASGPAAGFRRVETPIHAAACQVLEDEALVLVYAVVSRRAILELVWGTEFDGRLRVRRCERLVHGRGWDRDWTLY
jgi:hypothetical protein